VKDLPEEIRALPKHAQQIWLSAFNAAFEQYGDEEKAFGTAWAAVKRKYEKRGDRWVARGGEHMEGKWIPIFRTGRHTDSAGRTRDFTREDLDRIASQYDPASHEAPVVIGHPDENAPAYGWAEALKREGEILYARLKQLVPEFVNMVKQGRFKKRSISLYPDLSLRHIGFLGAAPPAVKGLPDVGFKSGEVAETYEFAGTDEEKEAQEKRSKKYGIGIKEGGHVTKPSEWEDVPDDDFLDPVNYRYPCPDADQTRAAASYWGKEKNRAQYTEKEQATIDRRLEEKKKRFKIGESKKEKGDYTMSLKNTLKSLFTKAIDELPDDQLQPDPPRTYTEAELEAKEDEAARRAREDERKKAEAEFAEREKKERAEKRNAEIKAYVEGLVKQGKAIPAWQKAGLCEFMESLDADEPLQFAEGKDKQSRLDWFRGFLEGLPKVIHFGEIATRDKDVSGQGAATKKLEDLTRKKMEERKDLTYAQAFTEVQRENPDLVKEYAEEQGINLSPARA
jgi:cation transport regulator ChaB